MIIIEKELSQPTTKGPRSLWCRRAKLDAADSSKKHHKTTALLPVPSVSRLWLEDSTPSTRRRNNLLRLPRPILINFGANKQTRVVPVRSAGPFHIPSFKFPSTKLQRYSHSSKKSSPRSLPLQSKYLLWTRGRELSSTVHLYIKLYLSYYSLSISSLCIFFLLPTDHIFAYSTLIFLFTHYSLRKYQLSSVFTRCINTLSRFFCSLSFFPKKPCSFPLLMIIVQLTYTNYLFRLSLRKRTIPLTRLTSRRTQKIKYEKFCKWGGGFWFLQTVSGNSVLITGDCFVTKFRGNSSVQFVHFTFTFA